MPAARSASGPKIAAGSATNRRSHAQPALLIELAKFEARRPASIPPGVVVSTDIDWRPWNESIILVNLVADRSIAEAAHALDEQIWRVSMMVKRGLTGDQTWLGLRDQVESAQHAFITAARRELSLTGDPLRRLSGRPTPDDPIWAG